MGKKQGLSRRNFLTGAAVGTAAVAGAGFLTACASEEPGSASTADSGTWDKEADVVVAGSGSGMAAAVCAISKGCSVIVCEKSHMVGGSTLLSGGGGWFPNTRYSQEHGDSRELALTYLQQIAEGQSTDAIIETFVDRADEILEVIATNSDIVWKAGTVYGDYHPEWEGGLPFGRACSPVSEGAEAGAPLITGLQTAIEENGNEILTETPVTKLITRENGNGVVEVIGVEAEDVDGNTLRIKANKGVVLATGGFEWDEELKTHFLRGKVEFNISVPGGTGDALRMCMGLGADLRNMNECWGHSCYKAPNEGTLEAGHFATIGLMYDRAKPGSIIVNSNGERYHNEACDYDTWQRAQCGWNTWGNNGYSSFPSYFICDQQFVERYGINQIDMTIGKTGPGIVDENAISADSIEELAEKIGVPVDALKNTVDRFNTNAKNGVDPDFHRGESYFDRAFMSDMGEYFEWAVIEATLGAVENPPYYAMECTTGTLGTCGGPRVNENAQVMHVSGEVIPRLYCTGNASSIGAPGASYAGAGGTLGPAITFGGIAALHAADLESWQ